MLVCTGNTCRSAMAEALMDDAIDRSSTLEGKIRVDSAGTFACEGQSATIKAQQVMEELGFDLDKHKAKQVSAELIEWADIILTMEAVHIEQLEAMFPEAPEIIHTMIGYAAGVNGFPGSDGYDMEDPYGQPVEEYRTCARQLQEYVDKIVKKWEAEGIKSI